MTPAEPCLLQTTVSGCVRLSLCRSPAAQLQAPYREHSAGQHIPGLLPVTGLIWIQVHLMLAVTLGQLTSRAPGPLR